MSTAIFVTRCHDNGGPGYPADVAPAKRDRTRKYGPFGEQMAVWRGKREIGVVTRHARKMGAKLTEPTLRGLEYGWTASPDPVTLAALSTIYQVPLNEMLDALIDARNRAGEHIALPKARPEVLPVQTEAGDFGAVPLMKGRIAAGSPLAIDDDEYAGSLAFSARFLARWKKPVCVRVGPREESMVPVITPDDVVLLECAEAVRLKPDPSGIYAVRVDGGATLKRVDVVRQDDRAWLALLSENPDKKRYPVRLMPVGDGDSVLDYIVGRVVWHGQYV